MSHIVHDLSAFPLKVLMAFIALLTPSACNINYNYAHVLVHLLVPCWICFLDLVSVLTLLQWSVMRMASLAVMIQHLAPIYLLLWHAVTSPVPAWCC